MTCNRVWPPHFPTGCPTSPHDGRAGPYYRLVSDANAPADIEFLPLAERPDYLPSGGRGARCSDCALSVFDSIESAQNFVAARPAFHARLPARIDAAGEHGVIHPDETLYAGHFLWWLPQGLTFLSLYRSSNHA
jgi:hypothetical protein